ncbi:MAG: glycosyltransferase family 4 protein [Candidatus Berkelbacteria bacterium]
MKLLWLSWKDIKNPLAGGAEVVTDNLLTRLSRDGNEIILLTSGYINAKPEETINGYKIIRVGGRWSVYYAVCKYYKANLLGWADIAIEEINTIPFFSQYYLKEKSFLFFHQLCRQIWFFQMFFPLSAVGYLLEPIYLWLLHKNKVITISESTKNDLARYGFKKDSIGVISEGIVLEPLESLSSVKKYDKLTLLSLGAIREMKRTDLQIKAFELAKEKFPELQIKIAGGGKGKYFDKVMSLIQNSEYKNDIEYLGPVGMLSEEKIRLLQKSHLILVTSIKEGWGLIVTEANSQGTPAAVYNIDGLRDSTKDGITGWVTDKNSPEGLAEKIIEALSDPKKYEKIRSAGWDWSKGITFDQSYKDFLNIIKKR